MSKDVLDLLIDRHRPCQCDRCEYAKASQDWTEFLSVFFAPNEDICYRVIVPRGTKADVPESIRYIGPPNEHLHAALLRDNGLYGVFFVVNSGGHRDSEITRFNAFFVESDQDSIEVQNQKLDNAPIPPSIRVETKKSVHAYWLITGPCDMEGWKDIQKRLINHFKADIKIKNPSRVMRIPYFDHVSIVDDEYVRKQVVLTQFHPHLEVTLGDMQQAFAPCPPPPVHFVVPNIDNLDGWESLHERTRSAIRSHPTYHESGNFGHCQGVCHSGKGNSAIFIYTPTGAYKCQAGCAGSDIRQVFGLPSSPEKR